MDVKNQSSSPSSSTLFSDYFTTPYKLSTSSLPPAFSQKDVSAILTEFGLCPDNILLHRISGAMTNMVFKLDITSPIPASYLLRIYGVGSEEFFHRDREIACTTRLSQLGLAPKIIGIFQNGRLEGWVESTSLTKEHLRDPETSVLIAREMAKVHKVEVLEPDNAFSISTDACDEMDEIDVSRGDDVCDGGDAYIPLALDFEKKNYIKTSSIPFRIVKGGDLENVKLTSLGVVDDIDDHSQHSEIWSMIESWLKLARLSLDMINYFGKDEIDLESYVDDIAGLRDFITSNVDSPIVFCHNDTQYGNILRLESGRIMLIDWEYGCQNYRGFDIANHFCEWASDFHCHTPHIQNMDMLPTKLEKERFLVAYLEEFNGSAPGRGEIDQLLLEVEYYTLCSHLIWGLWGVIQAGKSTIDFNYVEYARQRLDAFSLKLKELKI